MRFFADTIFLLLFFVLLIGWAFAWIHLLLVVALISLVLHLVRSRREA
jgi:hypothetical protein